MINLWRIIYFAVILVMLAAGFNAVCLYVRGRTGASFESCIAKLKQIDGAKATWALEHDKRYQDVPKWSDLIGETNYIRRMPICPRGGTYTLGAVGEPVRCTVTEHVLP
jgi:hypothetical protein